MIVRIPNKAMDCPKCLIPMSNGELSLEQTLAGFLAAGSSSLDLFFKQAGRKRLPIMTSFDTPSAGRCEACGIIVITGPHGTDSECLECGTMMSPTVSACPKCGWTYETAAPPGNS
jgi:hypothetical protein